MRGRFTIMFTVLTGALAILFVCDLSFGSVNISLNDVWKALIGSDCSESTRKIVINIRLVKAVVAIIVGMALSVSGLQMQTLFHNPLAGPYVLGISSGASLGVALCILAAPITGVAIVSHAFGVAGAAWIGAFAILIIIASIAQRIKDIMVILILGMMFSSGVGAMVQILQYLSREESLKAYVIWTMGSLGDVTIAQLGILIPSVLVGLILAIASIKRLNILLFGEEYAKTMGVDIKNSRMLIFTSTTLLAGTVTAFCGPIGFIGLAIPHVARLVCGTSDHRILMPTAMLAGAIILLACNLLSKVFVVPINAITALLGIPVVVWIVLRNKSMTV